MFLKRMALCCVVVVTTAALLRANLGAPVDSGVAMTKACRAFLETLSAQQKQRALFDFSTDEKSERLNWHYIPRERKGLPLKDLEGAALQAAHGLIRSALSEPGYDQAVNVMSLEEILYLLEGGEREFRRDRRDPGKYYLSVFGEPTTTGTWGWRVEGHHLSLNYTLVDGKVASSTPEFFGANPALVDAGPKRKIRVLGAEEDLARQVLALCTEEQAALAWRDKNAADDIRSVGTKQPETSDPVGLPVSKMSADQKKLMQELLTEYLKNMPTDVAAERRNAINTAGLDHIYFAWWGSREPNERHEYRVQGPTFLIEYNNTQNDANHLHTVWRNMSGDFNVPVKGKSES